MQVFGHSQVARDAAHAAVHPHFIVATGLAGGETKKAKTL
jgi:hypothetical protein